MRRADSGQQTADSQNRRGTQKLSAVGCGLKARIRCSAGALILLLALAIAVHHRTAADFDRAGLRAVIDNYTYDRGHAPRSLQDLVTAGYLRGVPAGFSLGDGR